MSPEGRTGLCFSVDAMADDRYPWYPWYIADYRGSRRVQRLDLAQRGFYRELLDECWWIGHIPDDVVKLAEIASCTIDEAEKHWPTVRRLFEVVPGLDGMMLYSPRMANERKKIEGVSRRRAEAGRKGGLSKTKPGLANTTQYNTTQAPVTQDAEPRTAPTGKPTQLAAVLAGFKQDAPREL